VRERRRVYSHDLGDDHAGTAFGSLGQEIDPARGDAIAGAVIGQGGCKRNAIAHGAPPELQRTEQAGELAAVTHASTPQRDELGKCS
jgi:hypothetical protein